MAIEPHTWDRATVVALNGRHFPTAAALLRSAGFEGQLTGVAYAEWMPLLQGHCDTAVSMPRAAAPGLLRAAALAWALLKTDLGADALIWAGGASPWVRRLLKRFSVCPVYAFYNGRLDVLDPSRPNGLPHPDPGGQEEAAVAAGYLAKALRPSAAAPGAVRVAVDGDGINGYEATGVQWFKRHLLASFCTGDSGVDLHVLSKEGMAKSAWELPWHTRMHAEPPAAAAYAPRVPERALPIETVTGPVDLFHLTFFERPRYRHDRMVATVYDVMPMAIPDAFPARFVERIEQVAPVWREHCQRILCISEATRDDLAALLDIPHERTVCIPPGKHPHFHARGHGPVQHVRQVYALQEPYVLAVGSLAPHKNLDMLVRAFVRAKERAGMPHKLALVGRPAWLSGRVFDAIAPFAARGDVQFTGYVPWLDLPALYAGATAFCMPSLYEGYGLPAQEAMCCGCPVLLSDNTALPETGGEAADYASPKDEDAWADAIERLATDDAHRAERKQAVLRHAATFLTWEEVARRHAEVYRAVVAE